MIVQKKIMDDRKISNKTQRPGFVFIKRTKKKKSWGKFSIKWDSELFFQENNSSNLNSELHCSVCVV